MNLNRRQIIKGIGAALCAGVVPKFVAELIGGDSSFTVAAMDWGFNTGDTVMVMEYYSRLPDMSEYTYIERDDGKPEILTRQVVSYAYGDYTVTQYVQ